MTELAMENFTELVHEFSISAKSPKELAIDYEERSIEWYHLVGSEEDFSTLISVPDIKWYTLCRCHLVAEDKSASHEHFHALVHFINCATLCSFRKKLQRSGIRLCPKTYFRNIKCLDHAVGLLCTICCMFEENPTRRDISGIIRPPHSC